tara:strand:- start:644 stop:862 length:219 start_codon:yes stop_codon:yes gene_type:complete
MPKPNKSKATGDKNSGYSNTLKINNTTYHSNKDIIYSHLSKIINFSLGLYEIRQFLKSDMQKLKKYLPFIGK